MIAYPKPLTLYEELIAAGVVLSLNCNGTLKIDAPSGYLTPELVRRVREHKQELLRLLKCDKCGSAEFHDVAIHNGRSTRRDCAICRRTAGFPCWKPEQKGN